MATGEVGGETLETADDGEVGGDVRVAGSLKLVASSLLEEHEEESDIL